MTREMIDLIRDNAYNKAINDVLEIIPKSAKYLQILQAILDLRKIDGVSEKDDREAEDAWYRSLDIGK